MQATTGFNLLDPSSWPGTLFLQVVAGLLLLAVLAILGWLTGPFKWWCRSRRLRQFVLKRQEFVLVYNPDSGARKVVAFLEGGQIGAGMNNNEHTWRVRRGALEFLAVDGELWNRFKIDQTGGRLSGTTDTDVRSVFGQYLLPQHRDLSAASVSSVPDVPALSREAQTLLKEGVQDSAGKLVRILSLNGVVIHTNGKRFVEQGNPRSGAIWEGALQELEQSGLIIDRGFKEVFHVTRKGYDVAGLLNP